MTPPLWLRIAIVVVFLALLIVALLHDAQQYGLI